MSERSDYLFDNAAPEAASRFAGLEAVLDATTFRHLRARGVSRGWACLEVGAGGGSVARWLAERVGPAGAVVATDLDLGRIDTGGWPNLEPRVHDVVRDPLEAGWYDLVHARLVLLHLPQREGVMAKLVSALKPGGWLVLEDFTHVFPGPIPDAEDAAEERVNRVYGQVRQLLAAHGADTQVYPRSLVRRLRRCGLTEVQAEGTLVFGHPGIAEVLGANVRQVERQLVDEAGIAQDDVAAALGTMADAPHLLTLPMLVSAWGRKP